MYHSLTKIYDKLFPLNEDMAKWIAESKLSRKILDIGCGTGSLLEYLANQGWDTMGLEPDSGMASLARKRSCCIKEDGMTSLDNVHEQFSHITCLGNTLPHLKSEEELQSFFKMVYSHLEEEGLFFIQIINFSLLLKEENYNFPDIDQEGFLFEREYIRNGDKVLFKISLTDNESLNVESGEQVLTPFSFWDILSRLKKAGFCKVEVDQGATDYCFKAYKTHPGSCWN